jgi:hypothetical protein
MSRRHRIVCRQGSGRLGCDCELHSCGCGRGDEQLAVCERIDLRLNWGPNTLVGISLSRTVFNQLVGTRRVLRKPSQQPGGWCT